MKLFGLDISRTRVPETRQFIPIEGSATSLGDSDWLAFFGGGQNVRLPSVTTTSALKVPAVLAAVTFLSRTLATLDLGAFRDNGGVAEPVGGKLATIIRDAPNPEWSGFAARNYFWQSLFTAGRGLFVIVRDDRAQPVELWPVNPTYFRVRIDSFGRKTFTDQASGKTYASSDVIDVPFYLAPDQINTLSPIKLGEKAIQLALAMNDFGSQFFAGGGMPPLAVEGQMPTGAEARNRAMAEINRSIDEARGSDKPIFAMPPGFKLTQVGYDPQKGQMTEARRFQTEEIARVFQLPPMFLQDLTRATFNNSEAQDLFLVKHLLAQWAKAFEDECNLKLFGQLNGRRFVRHDFNSLLRGDFVTRMNGLVRSVQGGIRTPNEARLAEGLAPHPSAEADDLFMQGATIPLDAHANDNPTPKEAQADHNED